uniref:Serine/threonine-protein phosphatase 6 regulatory ankyrin repeat subunit B-like n=1 Tax=Coturnix japonica TaxID=93934 RepID=A0A8C2TJW2_COTJA
MGRQRVSCAGDKRGAQCARLRCKTRGWTDQLSPPSRRPQLTCMCSVPLCGTALWNTSLNPRQRKDFPAPGRPQVSQSTLDKNLTKHKQGYESSLAKMLLKCGASADGKDERGQTALSYAVSQGFENTAEVLLEAGANLPSHVMESALFKAVQKNLHGIVAALADRGTDINAYNEMKYTPLLLACETGKAECAEVLIEKGAHLGIKTPTSDTALHLAVRSLWHKATHLYRHLLKQKQS